jgi:aspartate 1-decarboxylase
MAQMPGYCEMCRAKLHGLTVTQTELHYEGSITIDPDLLDASGIHVFEKVQVVNQNNGERFDTYVIEGERGSGAICLNGPAARLAQIGDTVLVIAYGLVPSEQAAQWHPTIVIVGENNVVEDARSTG